jgi:signal transduction histidine kinase
MATQDRITAGVPVLGTDGDLDLRANLIRLVVAGIFAAILNAIVLSIPVTVPDPVRLLLVTVGAVALFWCVFAFLIHWQRQIRNEVQISTLRNVVDVLGDPALVVSAGPRDLRILSGNNAAIGHLGVFASHVRGGSIAPLRVLFPDDDAFSAFCGRLDKVLSAGVAMTFPLRAAGGFEREIVVTRLDMFSEEGCLFLITVLNRATEVRRDDHFEGYRMAKERFMAMISHELRTPLNAVIGFSEMISFIPNTETGFQRIRAYAADINNAGTALLGFVDGILDVAASVPPQEWSKRTEVDVVDLCRKAVGDANVTMVNGDATLNILTQPVLVARTVDLVVTHGRRWSLLPKDIEIEILSDEQRPGFRLSVPGAGQRLVDDGHFAMLKSLISLQGGCLDFATGNEGLVIAVTWPRLDPWAV